MAFRAFMRQIPSTLEAFFLQSCARGKHIKTQPSFVGISAMCAWTNSKGFGHDRTGSMVIVTPQISGLSADGYDYGMLFSMPAPQAEDVLPQPRKVPYFDHDLWTERQKISQPNDRGNSPWARPIRPAGQGASYSTKAGSSHVSPSLVIFDKDGTLIDVNNVWIPWFERSVKKLEQNTGLELEGILCRTVGYCPYKREYTDDALLAHATIAEIKESFTDVLVESGVDKNEAAALVDNCDKDFDSGNEDTLEPLGDLAMIFETLKKKGIKTAICTTDNRSGTISALEKLGLTEFVDEIVCGDDAHTKPKPDPESALGICRSLNVCPSQTVMIGDTAADTKLGRNAGLGLTVGVLSGAGNKGLLEREADVVVESVNDLLATLFPAEFDSPLSCA